MGLPLAGGRGVRNRAGSGEQGLSAGHGHRSHGCWCWSWCWSWCCRCCSGPGAAGAARASPAAASPSAAGLRPCPLGSGGVAGLQGAGGRVWTGEQVGCVPSARLMPSVLCQPPGEHLRAAFLRWDAGSHTPRLLEPSILSRTVGAACSRACPRLPDGAPRAPASRRHPAWHSAADQSGGEPCHTPAVVTDSAANPPSRLGTSASGCFSASLFIPGGVGKEAFGTETRPEPSSGCCVSGGRSPIPARPRRPQETAFHGLAAGTSVPEAIPGLPSR